MKQTSEMLLSRLIITSVILITAFTVVDGWNSRNTLLVILGTTPMVLFGLWGMGTDNLTFIPKYQAYDGNIVTNQETIKRLDLAKAVGADTALHHPIPTSSSATTPANKSAKPENPTPPKGGGSKKSPSSSNSSLVSPSEFREIVRSRLTKEGVIITPAVIDRGYFPLAYNFYIGSILPLGLANNTLFLCVDKEACQEAADHGVPTYLYKQIERQRSGVFGSGVFVEKAMQKHYMIYDILRMGHSVLLTDLDMFWFKSPISDVLSKCGDCDFIIQSEAKIELNIGFMLVRPTKAAKAFYKKVIATAKTGKAGGAQAMFNSLVRKHKRSINYKVLNVHKYPDGLTYFETDKRMFPEQNPCKDCFLCHDNWIVGTEAKRFRYREHFMWKLDTDGYYSNPDRKYITYANHIPSMVTMNIVDEEKRTLRDGLAIAHALNRTLILPPRFHNSKHQEVPLHGVAIILDFEKVFDGAYRESTFLRNPLVPDQVKDSVCGPLLVHNKFTKDRPTQFITSDMSDILDKDVVTDTDIIKWLGTERYQKCSVLQFNSLYRTFTKFMDESMDTKFNEEFDKAYVKGGYRQLELLSRKSG